MGTFKKGILGGFSGKVGTVVGANWRGLDVMRSLPKKSKNGATASQELQRQKFAITMNFLSPLSSVLSTYFGSPSGTASRLNNAVSYHMKEAVLGDSSNYTIDYSKVLVSKGELVGAKGATVAATAAGFIEASWQDNSGQVLALAEDVLLLVVYNPAKLAFVMEQGAATRATEMVQISIPADFSGDTLHVWMGFVNSALRKSATSIYLGTLQAV